MSERQAKMKRKNVQSETVKKQKKTKFEIISNIIIVLLVVAFVGVGAWVIVDNLDINPGTATEEVPMDQSVPTVAEYIAENGITFDELMEQVGLAGDESITEETLMDEIMTKMNLGKYAEFIGVDIETLKTQMGIPAEYSADAIVGDVIAQMEALAAEQAEQSEETSTESETLE